MEIVDLDKTGVAARAAAEGEMALGGGNTVLAKQKYREAAVAPLTKYPIYGDNQTRIWPDSLRLANTIVEATTGLLNGLCGRIQEKLLPPRHKDLSMKQFLGDV